MQRRGWMGIGLLAAVGAIGAATYGQWSWIFDDDPTNVTVSAPTLKDVDAATEQLYRITPKAGSTLTYHVTERLAGSEKTATGRTDVLAGDIAVNRNDPSKSRVGEVVVNLETLHSDSWLRDKRIRHDFLQSSEHPYARFKMTSVEGLPTDGSTSSKLMMRGDLTVRDITKPVTFTGTAAVSDKGLVADATGTILMSDYDIGPIHVAGLANTDDEVRFDLHVDAAATKASTSTADLAVAPSARKIPKGEFAKKVQPILEASCATCHADGRSGESTVKLDTAGDAAAIADDIALVTRSRYMPPWPASDKSLTFEHDYSLAKNQIDVLQKWAKAGGGLDVDPSTKLKPADPPFKPIERDQVLPQRGVYVGSTDKPDDYRCFVHEFKDVGKPGEWIVGMAFEPDKIAIVHHSILYKAPAAAMAEINAKDGADGKPGWECYGLANLQTPGVISIGGWAPGQQPRTFPDGVGIYMEPGDVIVDQVHYHFDHDTPPDQSTMVFDTLSDEELAARKTPMTEIDGATYLTPAEGPCTPEESGPLCDRAAVLADIGTKYGAPATLIPDSLVRLCGGDITKFNQLDGTKFSSTCDLRARNTGTLYSVLGHMHQFGASYRMTLNPGTPNERILLDIPSWSFDWQLYYVPKEKIPIARGDTLRITCAWDRRNGPMTQPRYITWNEGTVDEMCFSSVSVVPSTDVTGQPNHYAG